MNFEVDDLKLLKRFEINKFKISLPVIKKNFQMDFYKWTFSEPLKINKYILKTSYIDKEIDDCLKYYIDIYYYTSFEYNKDVKIILYKILKIPKDIKNIVIGFLIKK